MPAIDDKVVAMSFENSKFESGATKTLSTLQRLKQALNFSGAGKGLDQIGASANRVDLSHIGSAVDGIKNKLGAMRLVAIAAFANVAMSAVSAGARMIKSMTLGPVIQGFHEYETQLNAVQTILSNTSSAGTNLKQVNNALNELNRYADKTIYNFSEMARNIGTFTAAGVDLKTSVDSIKGIANLAALSGSNSQQAATAMYQLSQAISAGRVNLQDWNSVVNAGMGGTIFQRALAQTAVHMGALDKNAVKLTGSMKNVTVNGQSFRQSIMAAPGKQSWLTGKVLTTTLAQLSGNLTDAQLKAKGYTDAQVKAIQTQAKAALQAATQVKTLSQLLDTTKEAIGSGWARTWQLIFGDFGEAKTLFTGLSNSIGNFVNRSSKARNRVLSDWKDLGGRTLLLKSLKQLFQDLGAVIQPIKDAFRDIFPAATGKSLYELTQRFKQFTDAIKPTPETINNLHRTFRGFFALLDIGKQLIGGVFTVFGRLFGVIGKGSGGFLNLTGNIGDFIVSIDQALKRGGKLHNFFVKIGDALSAPLHILGLVGAAIANLFGGLNFGGLKGLANGFSPLTSILQGVSKAWDAFVQKLQGSGKIIGPIIQGLGNFFSSLGTFISNAFKEINWGMALDTVKVGLLGGIFILFKRFFGGAKLSDLVQGFGGGILSKIGGPFDALTATLTNMQTQIKSKSLLMIAASIGILAASLLVLSNIDAKKMNTALSAMAIGFAQLLGAMKILTVITAGTGFAKIAVISGALVVLATAIGVLTFSVKSLSKLSWDQLAKGLVGVGTLLTGISLAAGPLSRNSAGLISAGLGITAIALALKVLASAISDFGGMSWVSLGKGIASVAASLGVIALAARAFPRNMVAIGAGLIVVSTGIKILAGAVSAFGNMNIATLGKGIISIGAALVVLSGAMRLIPRGMAIQAAGLVLVASSLKSISSAVQSFGGMSVAQIAKGLATLGGALVILAGGMKVMSGSLAGAAALTVAAAGLRLLAPALVILGHQSWTEIVKGMVALGAAIGILGAASMLLEPAAPAILALGVALLAIGGALALAGLGVAAIGVGLSAIAVAGPAAIAILIKAVEGLLKEVPKAAIQFANGLVQFVLAIGKAAPQMVTAFTQIFIALLQAVIKATPMIAQALSALIQAGLKVLRNNFPAMVSTGFQLLMSLLNGLKNNIVQVTNVVVAIVVRFINTLAGRMGQITAAGANLLVKFLQGIANNIGRVVAAAVNIMVRFLNGIASNIGKVITAGGNIVISLVTGIGNNLARVATAAVSAITHFLNAIAAGIPKVAKSGVNVVIAFINAIATELPRLADAGAKAVINFLNGVAAAIRNNGPALWKAAFNIGYSIVEGMVAGIASMAGALLDKVRSVIEGPIGLARKLIHIGSPSRVFYDIGKSIIDGLVLGVGSDAKGAIDIMADISHGLINSVKSIFGISSPSRVMHEIGQYIGDGFRLGLQGTSDDIRQVFTDLNQKLSDAMVTARQTIQTERDKISNLRDAKHPNMRLIGQAQAAIRENQKLLNEAMAGHNLLTRGLSRQKGELISLAGQYDTVVAKLDAANSALDDARRVRDDAQKSFYDQYSELPKIDTASKDELGAYTTALGAQITSVTAYSSTLDQLRKLGIDDATYQKLLSEGPEDQRFASQLLAGGKTAVDSLNTLDSQLQSVSKKLSDNASANLYQAGVDAALGIVNGLKAREGQIVTEMEQIANIMIKTIKRKLKIKSPSETFSEIGRLTNAGLSKGLDASSKQAIESARNVGLSAAEEMMNALSAEIDTNPTITPIMDLTNINAAAKRMEQMLNVTPITAAASFGKASAISIPTDQPTEDNAANVTPSIKFEQNNYSPKELSPIDVYRNTRNQLSQLKSALA